MPINNCIIGIKSRNIRFKTRCTPSKHSGLNSLSPKLPSNSEMMISTLKDGFQDLMSLLITVTFPFHVSRLCRNKWTYALGFFSTAKSVIARPDVLAARNARETNGPRPAPVTATIL